MVTAKLPWPSSNYAVRTLRPRARRLAITCLPPSELILARKPWFFLRRWLFGWNVLFKLISPLETLFVGSCHARDYRRIFSLVQIFSEQKNRDRSISDQSRSNKFILNSFNQYKFLKICPDLTSNFASTDSVGKIVVSVAVIRVWIFPSK